MMVTQTMPSQGHASQYKVTTESSKSTPSATSARGFPQPTSGTNTDVDLTTCSEVQFELRDGHVSLGCATKTLRIQLVGLLSSAGIERDLNYHPMFYEGFLLIIP